MVEVVFGASACGSLRQAQHYGKGPWHKPAIGAVLRSDGQPPTKEELRAVQRRAEERSRREWEEAVPLALGGNAEDIYCLELALSMGDISEEMPGQLRRQALENLIRGASPAEEARRQTQRLWEKSQEALRAITARSTAGETVRVWYSQQPDELCGMCFLLERLESAGTTGPGLPGGTSPVGGAAGWFLGPPDQLGRGGARRVGPSCGGSVHAVPGPAAFLCQLLAGTTAEKRPAAGSGQRTADGGAGGLL